jgi:hypothetical protein
MKSNYKLWRFHCPMSQSVQAQSDCFGVTYLSLCCVLVLYLINIVRIEVGLLHVSFLTWHSISALIIDALTCNVIIQSVCIHDRMVLFTKFPAGFKVADVLKLDPFSWLGYRMFNDALSTQYGQAWFQSYSESWNDKPFGHYTSSILDKKTHTRRFGDWSLSPSSGKYMYMLYFSSLYSMTWPPLVSGDMD